MVSVYMCYVVSKSALFCINVHCVGALMLLIQGYNDISAWNNAFVFLLSPKQSSYMT